MPALVLLGAQWGDEGKGKATDLLGGSVDYVVRYQAATTPATRSSSVTRSTHSTSSLPGSSPPLYAGHRKRRRRRPVGPALRAERSERARSRHVEAAHQRQRAHHHALQRHCRQGDGTLPRKAQDRHHRPRHRPDLRRQDQPGRIRVQDLYDESILTQKVEAALDGKNQLLTKLYNRRAIAVDQVVEELLGYAEKLAPYVTDTVLVLNQRWTTTRSSSSRAVRARSSTSTTARTPSSPPRTRPRAAPARARAWARRRSAGSSAS